MNAPATPGYTMNERALERWRDGRLTLAPTVEGGVEAQLRYEGCTCGGVPLAMIYRVTLGPEAEGHVIQAMSCAPAPGTDGHERMCSYFHTDGRILEIADSEKPLLGRPLAAVLEWRPQMLSAACLCATPSRTHKWSSVLQTLHYALHRPPAEAEPPAV